MLIKVLFALILGCAVIYGIYLLGMAIYNHFINSKRQDAAELEYQYNRLKQLVKEKELEY